VSLPADSLAAAILRALSDEVKTALDDGKQHLGQVMDDLKIKTLRAVLPDGTEVATLTRVGGDGDYTPHVADEDKFTAWVQENHPGEIVPAVRKSYRDALLEEIAGTGEAVPGVEFRQATSYVTVTFAKGKVNGREAIKAAHQRGEISLDTLLALPPGKGDEPGG
jgi:hypothetical protein